VTKIKFVLISLILFLAACSTPPESLQLDQLITNDNPALQNLNQDSAEGQSNKIQEFPVGNSIANQLQNPLFDADQVKILESNMVEWPDSCLGIDQPGVECIPQTTPGYVVLLEAKGLQFAYHADGVGSQFQPATQGLMWNREDENSGICDNLIIYLPDTAYACWCTSGKMQTAVVNLQDILSEEEYEMLINSLKTFRENTVYNTSNGQDGTALVSLNFHGQGQTFPNADQQSSLVKMAELIFSRIVP
jgi:hypothetical protein